MFAPLQNGWNVPLTASRWTGDKNTKSSELIFIFLKICTTLSNKQNVLDPGVRRTKCGSAWGPGGAQTVSSWHDLPPQVLSTTPGADGASVQAKTCKTVEARRRTLTEPTGSEWPEPAWFHDCMNSNFYFDVFMSWGWKSKGSSSSS